MLQGQRELTTVGRMLLSELSPLVNAQQGVLYQMESEESNSMVLLSAYASTDEGHLERIKIGEGLIGQCAAEKRRMADHRSMPSHSVPIRSGLLRSDPAECDSAAGAL